MSKPSASPAAPVSSGDTAGASRSKVSTFQVRVGTTRPGRAERVTPPSDGEESKKRQVCVYV